MHEYEYEYATVDGTVDDAQITMQKTFPKRSHSAVRVPVYGPPNRRMKS